MDIRDLEQFLAVLDHGSILGAAESSGVAQPALSRRMRALEKSLGMPLLHRTARGVTATVYGELLAGHARLVLADRQRAVDELRSLRDGVVGHARVGVGPALSGLLPRAIQRLCKERPGITFSVSHGTYDSLIRDLRTGEIDGAFALLAPGEPSEGLSIDLLFEERAQIFCAASNPLARRRSLRMEELADQRWVLMNRPRSIIETFRATSAALGFPAPLVSVETDSLDLIKSLVLEGDLLTPLPPGAMRAEVEAKRAVALPLLDLPSFPAGFIHRMEVLPPAVALLLEEVKQIA